MNARWERAARLKATAVHLGLSMVVVLAAAALVLGVWYPMPHREASGGRDLFTLMVGVDLLLGPLITFIVFDRRKGWPQLRRDLAVVVSLQLAALAYGMHTAWLARPVYLVHEGDRFRVVRAMDVELQELAKAPGDLQRLPWTGPEVISARQPRDAAERELSLNLAMAGLDIGAWPAFWRPYADAREEVLARAEPLSKLQQGHPERAAVLESVAGQTGRPLSRLAYMPMLARQTDWVIVLDAQTAEVVGYAPFDGFE